VSGLVLLAALVAAMAAMAVRRARARRLDRADAGRAGASEDDPVYVRSFDEIDAHLTRLWCRCGGDLERQGEGSRQVGPRRYRVARLRCQDCDRSRDVFFDTTDVAH
jgi:hypothetical protein